MASHNEISDRNWELLLEAINNNRVVPIIGDEFFYVLEDGKEINVTDFLVRKLSSRFNVNDSFIDFSSIADAIELENFINHKIRFINSQTDIYYEISQILQSERIYVRESLCRLIEINKFPLILTTSFIPGIEQLLSQKGGECMALSYERSADSDIPPIGLSGGKTVIYYLFGRCSRIKKSYMVTEEDLLEYIHLWHETDARPPRLAKYLANKFLMVLGCNYPNWLFKFFWHSIRNFSLIPPANKADKIMEIMQAIVSVDQVKDDADLERFLSRIHTSIYQNSGTFIQELIDHWDSFALTTNTEFEYKTNAEELTPDNTSVDVFISYASEDRQVASRLAEMLRNLGASVWFDKRELTLSDKYENEITSAIARAKRFMPVLSRTTLKEEPRFFRKEWAIAHRVLEDRFGLPFFAPVTIDDCNPNDARIPKTYRDCHIISFQNDDIELQLKKFIRSIR